MKRDTIERMRRVVKAQKMAELAVLAAARAEARHARDAAAARRAAARGVAPAETVLAMRLQSAWQTDQERLARTAEADAMAADRRAAPIAGRLALALGREAALEDLAAGLARSERAAALKLEEVALLPLTLRHSRTGEAARRPTGS